MNLPETLFKQLEAVPHFDPKKFTDAHQEAAPTSIRLHPLKGKSLSVDATPIPWCNTGYYLPQRPSFTLDPLLHAGAYYVQEASSMFVDHIVRQIFPERNNLRVLDLCAAPGGKSTLLASLLEEGSLLLSNEVIRSRATILEENMTRWGMNNTWVCSNDPRDLGRLEAYFDLVLVDAPCSGSGLFRKDPSAIAEWSENNVQLCSERQQRILADIWPALKDKGVLIYATCSYSPAEDEAILDFLAEKMQVESIPIAHDEQWGIQKTYSPKHKLEGYRFFPHQTRGEGFFIAVLQKQEGEEHFDYPKYKTAQNKKITEQVQQLLIDKHFSVIENERKQFAAIQSQHLSDWEYLRQTVYLRRVGILVGNPGPKEWIPEHDVALSVDARTIIPSIELSKEQALLYLKKEIFEVSSSQKGWHIVRYQGLGLGWIKVLGNRINNYLPKNWRIRMDIDFEQL